MGMGQVAPRRDRTIERVLVVDDEPIVLSLVCSVLEEAGYEVAGASYPTAALGLFADAHPDVVLIDLMLPEMDGLELAGRLQLQGGADIPLVAMSASTSVPQRAADSGLFREFLSKPFDLDDLVSAVERCSQGAVPGRSELSS